MLLSQCCCQYYPAIIKLGVIVKAANPKSDKSTSRNLGRGLTGTRAANSKLDHNLGREEFQKIHSTSRNMTHGRSLESARAILII